MKRLHVLFVDDEPHILHAIKRCLIEEEYISHFSTNMRDALDIMATVNIAVLVADMRMPGGGSGLQLVKKVKEKHPLTVCIVLSGYLQLPQILATINTAHVFRYLTKPWSEEELKQVLSEALNYYQLQINDQMIKEDLKKRNLSYQNIFKILDNKFRIYREEQERLVTILHFLLRHLKDTLPKEEFAMYEGVYSFFEGYLQTIPGELEKCNLRRLKDHFDQMETEIEVTIIEDSEFYGNYKFLSFFYNELLKSIQGEKGKLSLTIERDKEMKIIACLYFNIERESFLELIGPLLLALYSFPDILVLFKEEKSIHFIQSVVAAQEDSLQ